MSYPFGQFPAENYSTPSTPHEPYPQWDTIEREMQQQLEEQQQQPQQQQQQPQGDLHSPTQPTTYQTIQLEEPPHIFPSLPPQQTHDDTPILLHPVHAMLHDPGRSDLLPVVPERTPPLGSYIDSKRSSRRSSPSPASTSSTMATRSGRAQHHQVQQLTHPYRRSANSATGPAAARQQPQSQHLPQREHHVRFATQLPPLNAGVASAVPPSSSTRPSPLVPSPGSRITSFGSSVSSPAANNPSTLMPSSPRPTEDAIARSPRRPRYLIRSDVHYDLGTKTLTAMLELPGVKKSEVRVTLSTCYYNRVKQLTVYGRTRPVFPVSGFPEGIDGPPDLTVRERKFGDFTRTFAVPSETKHEDIDASMVDGILTLKIPCGMPAEADDAQDVPVR